MLIPVFSQDSYPDYPNHCNLWKLPQHLVPAPRSLHCESPFSLDTSFSNLTVTTGYCSYGLDYPLYLSTLDSLYVVNAFPPGFFLAHDIVQTDRLPYPGFQDVISLMAARLSSSTS